MLVKYNDLVVHLYPQEQGLTIIYTRKCTTLWGKPDRVHAQNMEQLHAFDCHQNVAEPQATENHIKYTALVKTRTGPDRTGPHRKSDGSSEQERQSSPAHIAFVRKWALFRITC